MKNSDREILLKSFGNHLSELRREKRISQDQLAFDAGIDLSTLSKIERGILNISIYNAYKIAKVLNIPYKELFDFEFPIKKK